MYISPTSNPSPSVLTIDYEKLVENDESEINVLAEATQRAGLFYLNLKGSSTNASLRSLPNIYQHAERYFKQEGEAKKFDSRPWIERGYKSFTGSETFEISHDERLNGETVLRGPLQAGQSEIFALATTCHNVTANLYRLVTGSVNIDSRELDGTSDTGLKLCFKGATDDAEMVASKGHTDSGLITLLFYDHKTLEIWDGSEKQWKLVEPKEDCAVVNIADALQAKSLGRLHSPLHRVVQPAGPCKDRYSAVYFLRP